MFPDMNIWYDNILVGTKRFADPGVGVQPPMGLTINKSSYPTVVLNWTTMPRLTEPLQKPALMPNAVRGHRYDCMPGSLPSLS